MTSSPEYEAFRQEYESRKSKYEELAAFAEETLEKSLREQGLKHEISSRVKETDSFLKKAYRKKLERPIEEIKDKIGIRVIATYGSDIPKVQEIVEEIFNVVRCDDKVNTLEYNELGYLGLHFEVTPKECVNDLIEIEFEIQVQTKAQNLWATISHELSYKPNILPSGHVRRSIYRLLALLELFDKEVNEAQKSIINQTDCPEAIILSYLERHYYCLCSKSYDRDLSMEVLGYLIGVMSSDELKIFDTLLSDFVSSNSSKLKHIYGRYSEDGQRNTFQMLLLFQPESLLIFERLTSNRFKLSDFWNKTVLPRAFLEFLANVWDVSLP